MDLVGGSVKLTITDVPPSLNKVLRMHWATKRKLLKNWADEIFAASYQGDMKAFMDCRAKAKITLFHSRFYDKDNAYGACKVVVDALRQNRLIFDDTAEWLELTVEQEKCSHKSRHTIIELESA